VLKEEEEVRWAEWAKRLNRPVGLLGWLGQNMKRNLFEIKIGFLNLQGLLKFTQGDLGGILMLEFFLISCMIPLVIPHMCAQDVQMTRTTTIWQTGAMFDNTE
jgi:hypothetical protein